MKKQMHIYEMSNMKRITIHSDMARNRINVRTLLLLLLLLAGGVMNGAWATN